MLAVLTRLCNCLRASSDSFGRAAAIWKMNWTRLGCCNKVAKLVAKEESVISLSVWIYWQLRFSVS